MIKVGIIGCGKIADQHAAQIRRIPDAQIVGVCDKEELMAKQLYDRYDIKTYFHNVNDFLQIAQPDVVHITTPPQSHFELGKLCLEAGRHVYIEKPFTINTDEAVSLIALANEKKLKLTVGHNVQFTPAALQMRELVKQGFLGEKPIHMESYYCYDLGDPAYAKALFSDQDHWVRKLPGQLLQNVISHGIGKISEFLVGDSPKVMAMGYTSQMLISIGERDVIDELRVLIVDQNETTAFFTFSTQMRPILHHFRIYGPQNGLILDDDHQTLIKLRGLKYKSYLEQLIPPYTFAKQYLAGCGENIKRLLKRELHNDKGMKYLFESFYGSILYNDPLPIAYREILLTSKIMDEIFLQVDLRTKQHQPQ